MIAKQIFTYGSVNEFLTLDRQFHRAAAFVQRLFFFSQALHRLARGQQAGLRHQGDRGSLPPVVRVP